MTPTEQAVLDSVTQLLESYARRDIAGCMAAISTSRAILLLGTNENEVLKTPDEVRATFRRDFEHMRDIAWGAPRIAQVMAAADLAGLLLELPLRYSSFGTGVSTVYRYALMLAREEGRWKVFAGMASVPHPARLPEPVK